jgi:adenylate cyclase
MRYVFDGYLLDTQRYELSYRGEAIKLRPKVFEVLEYLIRHRQLVVAKEELLEHLWPGQFIADGTLNACVMAVRKAVGDSGQAQCRIQTFHSRVYRFVATVEEQEHPMPGGTTTTAAYAAPGSSGQTQERGHCSQRPSRLKRRTRPLRRHSPRAGQAQALPYTYPTRSTNR